ncbi:PREDICTED: uncharacterized protein LOC107330301 [Acropora digitifera]|uniref:uncharacterized protein LOC107330301 n=1 Tax=Acropora digitifera TaxID=70779 RepID=UPI00077AFB7F|nr:PREDICTED: uncharacterized protein LOC107330301 [Acropora digitifera]
MNGGIILIAALNSWNFELQEDPATAKYAWRMFVAHHQFHRMSGSKMSKALQSSADSSSKEALVKKNGEVATSSDGTSSECSSKIFQGLHCKIYRHVIAKCCS